MLQLFFLFGIAWSNAIAVFTDVEHAVIKLFDEDKNEVDDSLRMLRKVNSLDLPRALRDVLNSTEYGEHMCCRNRPVSLIQKTRQSQRISVEKNQVKSGSHQCGLLLLDTCHSYTFVYRQVIKYVTEFYKVIDYKDCPEKHVVCCNYYIMIAEKCIHLDDLHAVVQQILG